jgi:GntR family transcriptional repressor for pyruvate dehydrogenase complex
VAIRAPIERVRADESMDTAAWLAADVEFHTAIAVAAKNGIIELAMTAVHLVRPRTNTLLLGKLEKAPVWQQHEVIYQAIEAQKPDAAVAALDAHVDYLASVQASDATGNAVDLPLAQLTPQAPSK